MANKKITASSATRALRACSLLAIIFILEELFLPISKAGLMSYHLSRMDYRLALIAVNLPIILVWFIAFWAYSKLADYSISLKKAPEAPGFRRLSGGLAWLAWSLPIGSIVDRLLSGFTDHQPKLHGAMTILSNYFNLIMPFIALLIIGAAARTLLASQKWSLQQPSVVIMVAIFACGALYCYLILRSFNLHSPSSTGNRYDLPAWLAIISLIIPYLYAWLVGLLASYQLGIFSVRTSGVLYKKSLRQMTGGLAAIIISFIIVQYLSAIWPAQTHLTFDYHQILTTLFRIIGGLGFISLALGASKLKMFEEV